MNMETAIDRRDPPRNGRSYKDSDAYHRSHRMRADGHPTFPLPFAVKPAADVPPQKRKPRYGLAVALVACAAIAVILERRR